MVIPLASGQSGVPLGLSRGRWRKEQDLPACYLLMPECSEPRRNHLLICRIKWYICCVGGCVGVWYIYAYIRHAVHIPYPGIWTLGYLLEKSCWNHTHLALIKLKPWKSVEPVVDTCKRSLKFTLSKVEPLEDFPMTRKGLPIGYNDERVSTAEGTGHISLRGTPSILGELPF